MSQLLVENSVNDITLCLASVPWKKPVFIVGFLGLREHGFSSAQRSAVPRVCVLSGHMHIVGLSKDTRLLQLVVQLPAQPLYGLLGFSSISKKSPGRLFLALRLVQSCGRHLEDSKSLSGGTRCAGLLSMLQLPSASLPAHTSAFGADWHRSYGRLRTPLAKRLHCYCLEVHSWQESCAV